MSDEFFAEDIFSSGGLLSSVISNFEEREGQIEMAKVVNSAFTKDKIAVIEAGTGIGKSFAYLASAIKAATEEDSERTVIATSTKNLQKQLFDKDIPLLLKAMRARIPYVLMMGRSNYLCLKRFNENEAFQSLLATDPKSSEYRFKVWAQNSETGLLDEYRGSFPHSVIVSDIASDGELCLGGKCPFFESCFYYKSKKKAEKAKLIVTNHHLLFSDASQRLEADEDYSEAMILPSFSRLVIDECHNIDKNATSLFTRVYSLHELKYVMRRLIYSKSTVKQLNLVQYIASEAKMDDKGDELVSTLEVIVKCAEDLNNYLLTLLKYKNEVLITEENFNRLNTFCSAAENLSYLMSKVSSSALSIIDKLDSESIDELKKKSFEQGFRKLQYFSEILTDFSSSNFKDDEVRYLNKSKIRGEEFVEASIAPISVAPILNDALFSKLPTVVCCSATLKVGSGFDFFINQVGLKGREILTGQFLSPFDYAHNLLLLCPYDGKRYSKTEEEGYTASIVPRIKSAIEASSGGALVLFTSYNMMENVYRELVDVLPYKLLKQGNGLSRNQLFEEFKKEADSCLFATQSFWEGVDAPGNTLRLVIITKLPYPNPDEPIFKARSQKLDRETPHSSYCALSLPEMLMKLKQGVGRLIRTSEDRGVVYILDSRMNKRRDYILQQLPPGYAPEIEEDESVSRIIERFAPFA